MIMQGRSTRLIEVLTLNKRSIHWIIMSLIDGWRLFFYFLIILNRNTIIKTYTCLIIVIWDLLTKVVRNMLTFTIRNLRIFRFIKTIVPATLIVFGRIFVLIGASVSQVLCIISRIASLTIIWSFGVEVLGFGQCFASYTFLIVIFKCDVLFVFLYIMDFTIRIFRVLIPLLLLLNSVGGLTGLFDLDFLGTFLPLMLFLLISSSLCSQLGVLRVYCRLTFLVDRLSLNWTLSDALQRSLSRIGTEAPLEWHLNRS